MIKLGEKTKFPPRFKWYIFSKIMAPAVLAALVYLPWSISSEVLGSLMGMVVAAFLFFSLLWWGYFVLVYKFSDIVVDDGRLTFNSGILTRRSKTVAFDRVQNVDVATGFIAAMFDISEISVWTASPGQASSAANPDSCPEGTFYLTRADAEWLRNFILGKSS